MNSLPTHRSVNRGPVRSASYAQGSIEHHFARLAESARELRKRVFNPYLVYHPYYGNTAWLLAGQDWRLAPKIWLRIVTPILRDDASWEGLDPGLKGHLADSPLWRHYDGLEKAVEQLEADYGDAAERLGQDASSFQAAWEKVRRDLEAYEDPWPAGEVGRPWGAVMPLPIGKEFLKTTLDSFAALIPGLGDRHRRLETQLQQLSHDLDPGVLDPLLALGSCERCA